MPGGKFITRKGPRTVTTAIGKHGTTRTYNAKTRKYSGTPEETAGLPTSHAPTVIETVDNGRVTSRITAPTPQAATRKTRIQKVQRERRQTRRQVGAILARREDRRKSQPNFKPAKALGMKTAGTPTNREIAHSLAKGNLAVDKHGAIVTPKVAEARATVKQARKVLKKAAPKPLPGLDSEGQQVARKVLRTGKQMGATHKELMAAAETGIVESGGFHNLPYGDADSEGWRQERTSQYGAQARNVRQGARNFFNESKSDTGGTRGAGETPGQLAQTIQGSAFPERYDEVAPAAAGIVGSFEHGKRLKPGQKRLVKKANALAARAGVKGTGQSAQQEHVNYLKVFGKQVGKELKLVKAGEYTKGPGQLEVGDSDVKTGHEPEIAARLKLLSAKIGKPIYIISGHRTPEHSVEVGGFADDPHTQSEAADIGIGSAMRESAGEISEAMYNSVGLHRPYYPESAAEINHVELLNGGTPVTGSSAGSTEAAGVVGTPTGLPSGAVSSYAAATGQSEKQIHKKLRSGKLSPSQILAKVKRYTHPSGGKLTEGKQQAESEAGILGELEKRYGSPAV